MGMQCPELALRALNETIFRKEKVLKSDGERLTLSLREQGEVFTLSEADGRVGNGH